MNKCSIKGCPGTYEKQIITHMVQRDGETIIIERVPADVCGVCEDILLSFVTVEQVEKLLKHPGIPVHTVPVYEMPEHIGVASE